MIFRSIVLKTAILTIFLLIIGVCITVGLKSPADPLPLPAHQNSGVVINLTLDRQKDKTQLELAHQSGAKLVRLGILWSTLEQSGKEQYTGWYLQALDYAIEQARQQGLRVLVTFSQTPCWASADPKKQCGGSRPDYNVWYPPAHPEDLAGAFRLVMQRYGSQVQAWEIWNEPNLAQFWGNMPPDAAAYVSLLKTAYQAAKAVNPGSVILGGSLSGSDLNYLKAMYQAGAKDYYDALALHPYSDTDPPDNCEDLRASFLCGVSLIHNTMLGQGDARPVWITEIGWSSYTGKGGVGEEDQAAYLKQAFETLKSWDFVPVAIWYNLIDRPFDDPGYSLYDKETFYGLYTAKLQSKPAAQEFRKISLP